ncbi:hypothetical protein A3SO_19633, partial [Pseudomonas syringae pv. actinidiae ICMP 19072]
DSLNIIWRKNEVYLDIGCYSVGSAVMVIWPMIIFYLTLAYSFRNLIPQLSISMLIAGTVITGIPTLMLIQGLLRPTWESVTAAATQCSSISQAGRVITGLLFIGFENPDPEASEDNKHFSMG